MFRLHWGEQITETITPKHVEAAIHDCSQLNNKPRTWAELEVVPTPLGPLARIQYGAILSNGDHERAIGTYSYFLQNDRVQVVHRAHL